MVANPEIAERRHTAAGLRLIAAFKFVKAAALIVVGLGALRMLSPEREQSAAAWLEGLALTHGHDLASALAGRALHLLDLAGPARLREVAVGAFLYATVFVVEGVGLARALRWAEYLTVGVTVSFLPFEFVALATRWTWPRAATVVFNLAVVAYLLVQIRKGGSVPSPLTPETGGV
ncbi:MAG TPA: DUF2127 domain-containing protein [Gemmatimonadales bacterium]|nr:DUF2127 domain-containing protein [Gemmatimonadales bacterium]